MVSADIQYMTGVEEHTKRVITCMKMFGKGRQDYRILGKDRHDYITVTKFTHKHTRMSYLNMHEKDSG